MATNVIKIKRTTGSTAPSSLNAGELAFSGGTGTQANLGQRLFIGDPANSNAVTVIGGNYFSNLLDHVHGTTTASSALIVNAAKSTSELRTPALYIGTSGSDTLVTSTAAELNILDGVTSTAAELNLVDGSSPGTVVNNKAVIYSSGGTVIGVLGIDMNTTTLDIDASDDITIDTSDTTGGIKIGAGVSGVPVIVGHTTSEVTVGDNLTVTGNLTVNGTTTTVNSTTVSIDDPIFEIGESGSDDNLDRGIKMKYNSGGAKTAFMGLDDSDGKFAFIPNASESGNTFSGTAGVLKAALEGNASTATTLSTASHTVVTALANLATIGTITTGVWNATAIGATKGGTGLTSPGSEGHLLVSTGSGFVMQAIDGGTYS
jgi:hypothetical protein